MLYIYPYKLNNAENEIYVEMMIANQCTGVYGEMKSPVSFSDAKVSSQSRFLTFAFISYHKK